MKIVRRNYNSGLCWEVWPENLPFWLHKFTAAGGDFVLVFNGTSVDGANSSWLAELRRGEGCTGECTGHTEIERENGSCFILVLEVVRFKMIFIISSVFRRKFNEMKNYNLNEGGKKNAAAAATGSRKKRVCWWRN